MIDKDEDDFIDRKNTLQSIEEIKTGISTALAVNSDDVQYAKANIRNLIQTGASSLEDLLSVAKASEHPRAYEVAANFIRTLVDANRELVDIKIKEDSSSTKTPGVDNRSINNFFVGSTSELLKMMKNVKAESVQDDE